MAKPKQKCKCCMESEKRIKGKVRNHYVRKEKFQKLEKKLEALIRKLEKKKKSKKDKKKLAKVPRKTKAPAKKKRASTKKTSTKKRAAKKISTRFESGAKQDATLGVVYTKAPNQIDDLKLISGVGPAIEKKLHAFGVYQFHQIATWKKVSVDAFDERLAFRGRIARDNWITQAKTLAK